MNDCNSAEKKWNKWRKLSREVYMIKADISNSFQPNRINEL